MCTSAIIQRLEELTKQVELPTTTSIARYVG